MARMRSSHALALAAFFLLLSCFAARKILPKKMKTRGQTYKVHASTDLEMCNAVVLEMHTEMMKHMLIENGEDPIFETAGMAICLGVVQNYTFEFEDKKVWRMKRRARPLDSEDDEEDEEGLANQFGPGGAGPEMMEGILLTKKACVDFTEEVQSEISEVMYAKAHNTPPEKISEEFCPELVKPQKRAKMHNADKGYVSQQEKKPPVPNPSDPNFGGMMQDFLKEKDHSGAINELLMMEAEHPEKMLDEDMQLSVKKGREELVCPVCRAAVRETNKRVQDLRSTPRYKDKWQREAVVTEVVQRICHGKDYERLQMGYYPAVPGNPPEWAESFDVYEKDGTWKMFRSNKKKAVPAPTPSDDDDFWEGEPEEDPQRNTMRKAMISLACKDAIDARLMDEEGDLAALLVDNPDQSHKWLAEQYCANVCKKDKEEL